MAFTPFPFKAVCITNPLYSFGVANGIIVNKNNEPRYFYGFKYISAVVKIDKYHAFDRTNFIIVGKTEKALQIREIIQELNSETFLEKLHDGQVALGYEKWIPKSWIKVETIKHEIYLEDYAKEACPYWKQYFQDE
jgi:hypothetical protein